MGRKQRRVQFVLARADCWCGHVQIVISMYLPLLSKVQIKIFPRKSMYFPLFSTSTIYVKQENTLIVIVYVVFINSIIIPCNINSFKPGVPFMGHRQTE